MKKSELRKAIENAIEPDIWMYAFIDKRENGYRIKFYDYEADSTEMQKIQSLSPNIVKVKNITSTNWDNYRYMNLTKTSLCVYLDCAPSKAKIA